MGIPVWAWILAVALPLIASAMGISMVMFLYRSKPGAQFRGPALTGTARVLAIPSLSVISGGAGALGNVLLTGPQRRLCNIALRVEIPGHEPYDATVWKVIDRNQVLAMESAIAHPVEVDSANPQNVRIEFNQPIT
jgi:hypothetical protein